MQQITKPSLNDQISLARDIMDKRRVVLNQLANKTLDFNSEKLNQLEQGKAFLKEYDQTFQALAQ